MDGSEAKLVDSIHVSFIVWILQKQLEGINLDFISCDMDRGRKQLTVDMSSTCSTLITIDLTHSRPVVDFSTVTFLVIL